MGQPRLATSASILVALVAATGAASTRASTLEAYPTRTSVFHGDTLALHVRTTLASYRLSIYRQGRQPLFVADAGSFPGQLPPVPERAWEAGCGWPVGARVPVQPAWRPGAYLARLESGSRWAWVPFVVRARVPGSTGTILVQLSVNTWQAYNRYGGKSLYGAYAPGLEGRARRVSFHRPYDARGAHGSGQFFLWEAPFLAYLESEGYAYEVCTNLDVHREPDLLQHYRVFCSVGHDEYYSKEMYDALERYLDGGGNLAFFSANAIWWQVRFEDAERTMVCYKSADEDPLTGIDNARVTVNWHAPPVLRPPARLVGLQYNGSYGVPNGAYQVVDPHHWVFAGTGVDSGTTFGHPMVGFELDSRTPHSPPRLDLLARTELPDSDNGGVLRPCEMVYFERSPAYGHPAGRSGRVFHGGSVNYALGLTAAYNAMTRTLGREDAVARTVTRNVLDRLGCRVTAPQPAFGDGTEVTAGARVLLQWFPGRGQRSGQALRYTLCWQAGGNIDSLETHFLSAWVDVGADTTSFRWWVRVRAACGESATSRVCTLKKRLVVDAATAAAPPSLVVRRAGGAVVVDIGSDTAERARVDVFDAAGRRIRALLDGTLAPGVTRCDWDLRDARGAHVGSGVYLIQARVGTLRLARKTLVVH